MGVELPGPMYGFGFRLARAMTSANFDQTKLAEAVGVHRSRIGQLLLMANGPKGIETIVDASTALGVSLDWLLLDKNPDTQDPWETDHRDLIRDLKELPPEALEGIAAQAAYLAGKVRESRKTASGS